jgi:hypothetical protein
MESREKTKKRKKESTHITYLAADAKEGNEFISPYYKYDIKRIYI